MELLPWRRLCRDDGTNVSMATEKFVFTFILLALLVQIDQGKLEVIKTDQLCSERGKMQLICLHSSRVLDCLWAFLMHSGLHHSSHHLTSVFGLSHLLKYPCSKPQRASRLPPLRALTVYPCRRRDFGTRLLNSNTVTDFKHQHIIKQAGVSGKHWWLWVRLSCFTWFIHWHLTAHGADRDLRGDMRRGAKLLMRSSIQPNWKSAEEPWSTAPGRCTLELVGVHLRRVWSINLICAAGIPWVWRDESRGGGGRRNRVYLIFPKFTGRREV